MFIYRNRVLSWPRVGVAVAAFGAFVVWRLASGDDPSEICSKSKPEVVETYRKLLNPMGLTDEQIKAAGGSPFMLAVSGGSSVQANVYRCLVTAKPDFLTLMGNSEGKPLIFRLEIFSNGKFYVTHES